MSTAVAGYRGGMEATGRLPVLGVTAADLPDIAELAARRGPFVSVYLDLPPASEDPTRRYDTRWRLARRQLAGRGAPEALLERVDPLVAAAEPAWPAIGILADVEGAVAVAGPEPLGAERLAFGTLPLLGPIVQWEQQTGVARAIVVVDRTGADIEVHPATGANGAGAASGPGGVGVVEPRREQVGDGDRAAVTKSQPGGWSQGRYQQRAENRWRANSGEVAARLVELTRAHHLRQIVLAGDVRAAALVVEQLPADVARLVRDVPGSRAAGGDATIEGDARRLFHTVVAEDTATLAERVREELGQQDQAVSGPAATIAALTAAAVQTVLVHDDPADDRTVLISLEEPAALGLDADALPGVAADTLQSARLVDAVIRAAWATGAGVRVTPRLAALEEGVAALLRFGRAAVPLIGDAVDDRPVRNS